MKKSASWLFSTSIWHACVLACASVAVSDVGAAPVLLGAAVTVDKPAYSDTYSLGVQAIAQANGAPIAAVTANHAGVLSGSFGLWSLADIGSRWWAWAPQHVRQADGPLDGTIEVTVRDAQGGATSIGLTLQPDQEMEQPEAAVTWTGAGFAVSGQRIAKADYYNLWLWDPIAKFYPSSQRVADPNDLSEISSQGLVEGRQYNLYWMANNEVDVGQAGLSVLYRSYSLQYLTVPPSSVPEPGTMALVAVSAARLLACAHVSNNASASSRHTDRSINAGGQSLCRQALVERG
jgi:hypothetical protein